MTVITETGRPSISRLQEFKDLAEIWRRETGPLSALEDKFAHPAYQKIIGMGEDAVPLVLNELRLRPGHWFWALKQITGQNPMRLEHAGSLRRMTEDWLTWGEKNGGPNTVSSLNQGQEWWYNPLDSTV